jgi:hypothetical protein
MGSSYPKVLAEIDHSVTAGVQAMFFKKLFTFSMASTKKADIDLFGPVVRHKKLIFKIKHITVSLTHAGSSMALTDSNDVMNSGMVA